MPRAAQPAFLYGTLTERSALVGARVVEHAVVPVDVGDTKGSRPDGHHLNPALRQLVVAEHLVPFEIAIGQRDRFGRGLI